ncbi:uncharacterized protein LOC108622762 [Ceratina calcarata]|uniref:Uncharacterized protein LOC108622762 n=1 Tax=Ceratina calcarata TaxID=156304 RepID=A0AAJ7W8Z1_9HYME|nr:uncharacterized protein LOC108622762 [Ceratina calcarata]
MTTQQTAKLPPDGKWGWMIVLAFSLSGLATISILQGFGLIFKDTFPLFGFTATEGSIILNTNLASGNILGLVNGPLLAKHGYRKMAAIGSAIWSIAIISTAFAKTFTSLLIVYGICASMGLSIVMSAFSFALNSYFTTKRGRAASVALTLVGLGPIIVPQVTSYLISYYGFQGTILLYGAFTLHSLVASTLLQPLKWHTIDPSNKSESGNEELLKNEEDDDKSDNFKETSPKVSTLDLNHTQRRRKLTVCSIDHDSELGSIYGIDIPYSRQMSETISASMNAKDSDIYRILENGRKEENCPRKQIRNRRFKSVDTINLGSSMKIFEEEPLSKYNKNGIEKNKEYEDNQTTIENETLSLKDTKDTKSVSSINTDTDEEAEEPSAIKRILKTIVDLFDLDLLRDPIYVNIMLGMSVAIFAEINFSQLTPFILMDMHLSTKQIATVLSILGIADLIFRSLASFIGDWLHQTPRIMYLSSLCLLIVSRMCVLFVNDFVSMCIVAVGLGIAKGIRSVYMTLVIPSYVPIHRLPNASGIQMIVNGVMLLSAGPLLGLMRDHFGSYGPCIIAMNCVTALTVTMWLIEMVIVRRKKLRNETEQK